jgi:hypothetical protein
MSVGFQDIEKTSIKNFVVLVFLNKVASDLHALLAALLVPPDYLGEVRRHTIFDTPSRSF